MLAPGALRTMFERIVQLIVLSALAFKLFEGDERLLTAIVHKRSADGGTNPLGEK